MNRKILFNTWAGAFFNEGGGEAQLKKSQEYLEKLGFDIALYNMWTPQKDFDIFHQFSIQFGVETVVNNYKTLEKKIALSTIMWDIPDISELHYHHVRNLFVNADILLTNSNLESYRLSDAFEINFNKFHKTRNSIADEYRTMLTSSNFREIFSIEGDFVLSVANIDTRKNTHNLIKACAALGLQFISIGHIRDVAYFESFNNKYSNFRHIGSIADVALLKSAYQQCLLFALPSLCETPGIAALEAASQGARVVITQEGAAPEYFEDMVTYVNPLSLTDIKEGIDTETHITRDETLRKHVVANYTWDKTALDIVNGYNKILAP